MNGEAVPAGCHALDGGVVACFGRTFYLRTVRHCPTCEQRRRMVHADMLWYGMRVTCLTCGDSWGEQGREPRPFAPRWRPKAAAAAKQKWEQAGTRTQWRAWVRQNLES